MIVDFNSHKSNHTVTFDEIDRNVLNFKSGGVNANKILCLKSNFLATNAEIRVNEEDSNSGEEDEGAGKEDINVYRQQSAERTASAILMNAKAGVRGIGKKAGVSPLFFSSLL